MDEKYSSNSTMDDSQESSNGVSNGAAGVAAQVQEKVTPVANQIREAIAPTVEQAVEQGKQKTGEVVNQAKEKAVSRLDEQKAHAAGGLGSVAETLRESGQHLREKDENPLTQYAAHYTESVANQVDGVSRFLREKSVTEIVGEVEGFARREPAFFLAGAFLLGVLGARFVRSSAPGSGMSSTGYNTPSGSSAIVPASSAATPLGGSFSGAYASASGESTSDVGSTSGTDFGTGFESETAVNSSANNGLGRSSAV